MSRSYDSISRRYTNPKDNKELLTIFCKPDLSEMKNSFPYVQYYEKEYSEEEMNIRFDDFNPNVRSDMFFKP